MESKKYAFFDVDKTIYDGHSTPDFLKFLAANGVVDTRVVGDYDLLDSQFQKGEITYSDITKRSTELFAKSVKGLREIDLQEFENEFFLKHGRLYLWVPKVMDYLQKNCFDIILISATVHPILDTLARFLPIKHFYGSELEMVDGVFTGKVVKTLNNEEKSKIIKEFIKDTPKNSLTIGFGDSPGDIEMLKNVNIAFVINPRSHEMLVEIHQNEWNASMDADEIIKIIEKNII